MKQMTKTSYDEVLDSESVQDQTVFLEIENKLLKEKLGLSPFCSYFAEEMTPAALNDFLRHMLFMEDIGPKKPIRSLFPPDTTFLPGKFRPLGIKKHKPSLLRNLQRFSHSC